jgi:hypothetical protein
MRRPVARSSAMERNSGQTLVEFALVFPIFALLLFSIIVLGLYVFYQQQLSNAAREAARYAAIHSSTAQCPTTSWQDPQAPPLSYYRCDPPASWPLMTAAGRNVIWGMSPSGVQILGCWSGPGDPSQPVGPSNPLAPCKIGGVDPASALGSMPCTSGMVTTPADDTGSDVPDNHVTVYACTLWSPPMAGFVFIPTQVTLRAVVTQVIHRQQ